MGTFSKHRDADPREIRARLLTQFEEYFPRELPFDEVVANMPDEQLHQLYQQGYCSQAFEASMNAFFSSEFGFRPTSESPLLEVIGHHLENDDQGERTRNSFFSDVQHLASSISAKELGRFLDACTAHPGLFPEVELRQLKKIPGRLLHVVEMAKLDLDWSDYCSKFGSCLGMVVAGGTPEAVRALLDFRDGQANPVFKTAWDVRHVVQNAGTVQDIKDLSFKNAAGYQLFETPDQYANALAHCARDRAAFISCCEALDQWGRPVFGYGDEINDFRFARGQVSDAIAIANLEAPGGGRAFNGYEITIIQENKVPFEICQAWAAAGLDAVEQVYCRKLKLPGADFANDGRRKALLLIAVADSPMFGSRVFLDNSIGYLTALTKNYDICLRAMWRAEQAHDALQLYGSEVDFVDISGHGSRSSIALGRDVSRYGGTPDTTLSLDIDDYSLLAALSTLRPGAIVFLNSCATAEGGLDGAHLASFIGQNVRHIGLIAASAPFSPRNLILDSVFPIKLKIFGSAPHNEITYTSFDGVAAHPQRSQYDIHQEQMATRCHPRIVPKACVHGPLRESPALATFQEVKRAIERACYPLHHQDEYSKALNKLSESPHISIIQERDVERDYGQQPWQWLFGDYLRKPWCPSHGNYFASESTRVENDPIGFLVEQGFRVVREPRDGDIAIYYVSHLPKGAAPDHPLENGWPYHFGIYDQGDVVSKPYQMHVLKHDLDLPCDHKLTDVPHARYIVFMRDEAQS